MDDPATAGPDEPLAAPQSGKPPLLDLRLRVDTALEIRLLREEDAAQMFELTDRNREHLAPWMSWIDSTLSIADSESFMRAAEKDAYAQTAFKCGIRLDGQLVGAIDLHEIDWLNRRAQIGYWLDKGHTGRGIVTRCVQRITQYAFVTLGLHRIEIHVATDNVASRHIPERLGFTFEGVLRHVQYVRGRFLDHAVYALIQPASSGQDRQTAR